MGEAPNIEKKSLRENAPVIRVDANGAGKDVRPRASPHFPC